MDIKLIAASEHVDPKIVPQWGNSTYEINCSRDNKS